MTDEARKLIRQWCVQQREKYGPDWKNIVATQMSAAAAPYVEGLLKLGAKNGDGSRSHH